MALPTTGQRLAVGFALVSVAVLLMGGFPALASGPHSATVPTGLRTGGPVASTTCATGIGACELAQASRSLEGRATGAWVDLTNHSGTAPPERDYGRSMAWDPATGFVLLFGGDEDTGYANDTWAFENGSWTNLSPSNAPSGRDHGTLVWDPVDHYMLLFGGSGDGGAYNDTWKFANGTWTQIPTKTAPSQRWSSSLVWDTADGYGLLFGGCAGEVVNDTWTYVGGVWTNLTLTNAPPPLGDASMVYDPAIGRVVLFGGADWYGNMNSHTWEYHAGNWTELTGANSPPGRTMASSAYDPALGEEILFGGDGALGYLSDTWAFTGTTWVELFPPVSPSAREFGELAWNAANNSLLLFSGAGYDDTWAYYVLNVTATATPSTGTAPLQVALAANSTGAEGNTTVVWQLGNGTMVNGTDVNATYTTPGTYFPTAEVTDGSGAYATAMVEVQVRAPIAVNAFADPTSGPAPLKVLFGAAVSGGIAPYSTVWSIGGGSPPISSETNGSYVFDFVGQYVLNLTVEDSVGTFAYQTFAVSVSTTPPPPLTVEIVGGPTMGEAPFNGTFTVLEHGGVAPFLPVWTFGAGGQAAGATVNYTFGSVATYPVEVQVTGAGAETAAAFLNVTALAPLTTGVTASVETGIAPLKVAFTASPSGGTGTPSVRWDFGDGASAAGTTTTTTYTAPGTYTATAVATDALGGYGIASVTIEVTAATVPPPAQHTNQTAVTPASSGVSAPEAGAIGAGVVGVIAVIAGLILWRRRPGG